MSDSSWTVTWRDTIIPLLCPRSTRSWTATEGNRDRVHVVPGKPTDEDPTHRRPRKTTV